MLDFSKIFTVFGNFIIANTRVGMQVLQARTTGAKPKGLFATFDIINITEPASYLTNKTYNDQTDEYIYETHKDIHLQISIRNSNPDDLENQMNVITYSNNLINKLKTEDTLLFFRNELDASIISVSNSTLINDILPSGLSSVSVFNMIIRVVDVVSEYSTPIQQIVLINNNEDDDLYTDIGSPIPILCEGLSLVVQNNKNILVLNDELDFLFRTNNSLNGEASYNIEGFIPENSMFEFIVDNIEKDTSYQFGFENNNNILLLIQKNKTFIGLNNTNNMLTIDSVNNNTFGFVLGEELDIYLNGEFIVSYPVNKLNNLKLKMKNNISSTMIFNKNNIRYKLPNTISICGDVING